MIFLNFVGLHNCSLWKQRIEILAPLLAEICVLINYVNQNGYTHQGMGEKKTFHGQARSRMPGSNSKAQL